MTGLAIALVLGAALIHASWNYLLKRSGGGIGFVWAFAALSSLLYAPLAAGVVIVQHFEFTIEALAFLFASAVLHTAYYLLLDRGYRHGDLSLVYPLARATGPFLTILVAVAMLGERPGTVALCGAALVVGGAFFLAASPARLHDRVVYSRRQTGRERRADTAHTPGLGCQPRPGDRDGPARAQAPRRGEGRLEPAEEGRDPGRPALPALVYPRADRNGVHPGQLCRAGARGQYTVRRADGSPLATGRRRPASRRRRRRDSAGCSRARDRL